MKNLQAKFVDFVKKHKILSITIAVVIVLCTWWAWGQFAPHPLGDKMEYLGKEDYGNIFGFDSQPYSEYHYGTNLSPQDVPKYFKGCNLKEIGQLSNEYASVWLTCDENTVLITYYRAPRAGLKTNKKYFIGILDEHYDILRKNI